MLQRNRTYTGLTRGRKLVVLVGQKQALATAVRGSRTVRRWSELSDGCRRHLEVGPSDPARRSSCRLSGGHRFLAYVEADGCGSSRKKNAKSRMITKAIAAGHSQIHVQLWTTASAGPLAYMSTTGPETHVPISMPTP